MLALCLLALLQDDVDRWIRDLGGDLNAREEAERRLKTAGDDAVPALRKAAQSADPEIAARARNILACLDRTRRVRELLSPGKPLTLEIPAEDPIALRTLLERIASHFGVALDFDETLSPFAWSGRLDGRGLLETLDRLSGDVGFAFSSGPGVIFARKGDPDRSPRDYAMSFKISAPAAGRRTSNRRGESSASAWIELEAFHQSGAVELSADDFAIHSVRFDTGESVVIPWDDPEARKKFAPGSGWGKGRLDVFLPDPPASATSIRRLRGSLRIAAPAAYDTWTFERLEAGTTVTSAGVTAILDGVDRGTYDGVDVVTVRAHLKGDPLGQRRRPDRAEAGDVIVLSKDGKPAPPSTGWRTPHRWGLGYRDAAVESRFLVPKGAAFEPATVVIRLAREWETVDVPFEIRDIPLR